MNIQQVKIDSRQYQVDSKHAHRLFPTHWNEAVGSDHPDAVIDGELDNKNISQWRWAIEPLIMACRQAFSAAMRAQFQLVSSNYCGRSLYINYKHYLYFINRLKSPTSQNVHMCATNETICTRTTVLGQFGEM